MSIQRLPYKLPEWSPRVIYVSAEARSVWQPRISAISNAWINAERDSVAAGIRKSALQQVSPERLPELLKEEAGRGLLVLPLAQTAKVSGYQSASKELKPGEAFDYKVVITRPEYASMWAAAWNKSEDRQIGELLSTPQCCIDAFERYWKQERWIDLTVPTHPPESNGYNGLLRWLGVRSVSHLPCSPTCTETVALSKQLLANMTIRHPDETSWLQRMLNWPTLYTSLNGIAEITNPILRMSVPSDALAEKAEVRYLGTGYPTEGARGTTFPFRMEVPIAAPLLPASDPAANGFSSREAMQAAHDRLLALITGRTFGTVLDLGAGDGTLLTKVPCKRRVGIEIDPARAKKAASRIERLLIGDCSDLELQRRLLSEETPDLVIAQRDRNPPETLLGFTVLSYSYEVGAAEPILLDPASVV